MPAMTTRVIKSFAGTESLLQEREGSGKAIAALVVPVIRVDTLRDETIPSIHNYQLTSIETMI
jgi:hypothetical protein